MSKISREKKKKRNKQNESLIQIIHCNSIYDAEKQRELNGKDANCFICSFVEGENIKEQIYDQLIDIIDYPNLKDIINKVYAFPLNTLYD